MQNEALNFLIKAYTTAHGPDLKGDIASGIGKIKTEGALRFLMKEYTTAHGPDLKGKIAMAIGECSN